jgi:EAL domain-containing protein (putative c-di-GMP-specific phosphodiesterase class I)
VSALTDELTALQRAVREVLDPGLVMQRVVNEALVLAAAADGATVELVDPAGHLTCVCAAGTLEAAVGAQLSMDASLSGHTIREDAVLACDDTETDARVDRKAESAAGAVSMVCIPLRRSDRPVGVLKLTSKKRSAFESADFAMLGRLADVLGAIVGSSADVDAALAALWGDAPAADSGAGAVASPDILARFVANVLAPDVAARHDATERVRTVLHDRWVGVVFQPIVDLRTGDVVAHEALARFNDGRTPNIWFDEAHEAGLGIELELLALNQAIATFPPSTATELAINVSPASLISPELLERVGVWGRERTIIVEVTEHTTVLDYDVARRAVMALRDLGARIAVDDVGSGYASLRHVVDLQPDIIKIDRSLVSGVDVDPVRQSLAVAFVELAAAMGWEVVAEGIERLDELVTCRRIGMDKGQGYLLGRPLPSTARDRIRLPDIPQARSRARHARA